MISCNLCGSTGVETFYDSLRDDRYGCPDVVSLLKCSRCSYLFTYPYITDDRLPSLYERYYPRGVEDPKEILAQCEPMTKLHRLLAYFRGTDNQAQYIAFEFEKFLDVGSGSGGSALQARNLGCEVWTIEADPSAKKFADAFGFTHHVGMLQDAPAHFTQFDVVAFNQVLEHVTNPRLELRIALSRLSDQGKVFISVPNSDSLLAKISAKNWINWHVPFHVSHFSKSVLLGLLVDEGYEIIASYTRTPNMWVKIQILRYLGLDRRLIWSRHHEPKRERKQLLSRAARKVILVTVGFVTPVIARCLDLFHVGESICVVARKAR
jgi:SAM-dependent methyltransferase